MKIIIPLILFMLALNITPTMAQGRTDIESASIAVEKMLDQDGQISIIKFMDRYMVTVNDRKAMIEKIEEIRKELLGLRDGIGLDLDTEGAILTFASESAEKRLRIKYNKQVQRITNLFILPTEEKLKFDIDNLGAAIQYMKDQDMAGLIYLKSKGEIVINEPFGMANKNLGIPNSIETIFAIGSRPIDFTKAAILLLDQEDSLSLEDPLGLHLNNVPVDKQTITLKHLMSGKSGLPDFFDNEKDWDPDLQWVSRSEAIQRMLKQTLLFEPGKGYSHSHGAFGLLAAIVELRTGKTYMEYLKENFFDPAGMTRTGEYGEQKDLEIKDFAVGGGPQFIGLPNIPPNWGPTSWLIKGSGGMYSTVGDLLKFYSLVRNGEVFDTDHAKYFNVSSVDIDGSMRGFELFSAYNPPESEMFLFLNNSGEVDLRRKVFRALEDLIH